MKRLKKRQTKLLITLVALLITLFGGLLAEKPSGPTDILGLSSPGYYQVKEVADGDTIVVNMNGQAERIRMIGVDTPETSDPRKPVQCFGRAATEFTKSLIANNTVRLESDSLSTNRDRYNRLLRYVYLPDGQLVNAEIIKHGFGFAYTSFPFAKSEEFKVYEINAREASLGLWGNCQPQIDSRGFINSNPE